MAEYTNDNNTFEMRTASLLERLHNYFDDAKMQANRADEQIIPQYKFRTLILTAEIFEYIRLYIINLENYLSEYFSERTLKRCLENVEEIEELQECVGAIRDVFHIYDLRVLLGNIIKTEDSLSNFELAAEMRNKDYKQLHDKGFAGFYEEESTQSPSIAHSLIWNAKSEDDVRFTFGRLFAKAKEQLDSTETVIHSKDPEIHTYSKAIHQKELSRHIAFKAKKQEHYINDDIPSTFDFLQYIIDIQKKAEEASGEIIVNELSNALEMLRNVFMTEAEDIYYIRTGEFSKLQGVYTKETIEYYYTDLPFRKYYEAKEKFTEQLSYDIDVELGEWRVTNNYIERPLKTDEYDEFLQIRKEEVIENMRSYEELWKLRMHSGGLDTGVTPENFARMFYRREGVDKFFIELQWKLELITSMAEANKLSPQIGEEEPELSPEQKAVADFVDKIIILAINTYSKWNNKWVSPGVHKSEVFVVIKKEELIGFIQNEMKNNFEELKGLCYPASSTTKQNFCKYVIRLQKEDYFGALPNKLLAEILAPIVELSPGTTNNYLSIL